MDETKKLALLKKAGGPRALVKNFRALTDGEEFPKREQMLSSLCDGGVYFAKLTSEYERKNIVCIPLSHALYPEPLKRLTSPPICVYIKGNAALLKEEPFAVVGSRRTAEQTVKLTQSIVKELSERTAIITGTADGGDHAAAVGAMQGSKKLILFAAGGIDHLPKSGHEFFKSVLASGGLILSACPPDEPVYPYSYERRNKLLATLGKALLVVSAGEKSGALITAKYAVAGQKPVFALPYPPSSATGSGCNALIKSGATLTETANDIFKKLGIAETQKPEPPKLTEKEQAAYDLIKAEGETPVAVLAQKLGTPPYLLAGTLTALEVKGLIVKTGGNKVAPVV